MSARMTLRQILEAFENGDDAKKVEALEALKALAESEDDTPDARQARRMMNSLRGGSDAAGYRAVRMSAKDHVELRQRMGIDETERARIHWAGHNLNTRVFPVITKAEAQRTRDRIAAHRRTQPSRFGGK